VQNKVSSSQKPSENLDLVAYNGTHKGDGWKWDWVKFIWVHHGRTLWAIEEPSLKGTHSCLTFKATVSDHLVLKTNTHQSHLNTCEGRTNRKVERVVGEQPFCFGHVLTYNRRFGYIQFKQCFDNRADTLKDGTSAMRAPRLDLCGFVNVMGIKEKICGMTYQTPHLFREFIKVLMFGAHHLPTLDRPLYLHAKGGVSVLNKEKTFEIVLRLIQHSCDSMVVDLVRSLGRFGVNSWCKWSWRPGVWWDCT
jgi:hypothetical protein